MSENLLLAAGLEQGVLEKLLKKGLEGLEVCENRCQLLERCERFLRTHFASFPLNGVSCGGAKHQTVNFHGCTDSRALQPCTDSHCTARRDAAPLPTAFPETPPVGETAIHFPTTATTRYH